MAQGGGFSGFSFGSPAAPAFGAASAAAPTTTASSFAFGSPAPAMAPTFGGLSSLAAPAFGAQTSAAPAFGAQTPAAPAFGAQTPAAPAFGAQTSAAPAFGAQTPAAPAFGSQTSAAPAPSFGILGSQTSTQSAPLSFGAPTSTSALSFGKPVGAAIATPATPATTSSLSFGAVPSSAPPAFGSTFGTPSTASSGLTFGAPAQATLAPTLSFGAPASSTTANTTLNTNTGPAIGFGSTTTTTQSAAAGVNQLTFSQIEELINKYTSELEEQEKVFINQATQVNSWDNLLNKNSKKIVELSDAVEKVKSEQKCLEDELKFIETQHTELEEFIVPLKKEVDKIPHSDVEKAQTYSLAENLDTQLRHKSEDLKEVIEHLNEVSKLQNSNDPVVQIGRILNAHMTSLQWIEMQTSNINSKLEEINKMYDTLRRDTERSLRLTYCEN